MKLSHLVLAVTALTLTAFAAIAAEPSPGKIALRYVAASDISALVKGVLGSSAASAITLVDIRTNSLVLDSANLEATKVCELIAKVDQRPQSKP